MLDGPAFDIVQGPDRAQRNLRTRRLAGAGQQLRAVRSSRCASPRRIEALAEVEPSSAHVDVVPTRSCAESEALDPGGNAQARLRQVEPKGADPKRLSDVEAHRAFCSPAAQ